MDFYKFLATEKVKKETEKESKSELLIKQLIKKFKILPDEYKNKLRNLPSKTIDDIGIDIFDLESVEDLKKYF